MVNQMLPFIFINKYFQGKCEENYIAFNSGSQNLQRCTRFISVFHSYDKFTPFAVQTPIFHTKSPAFQMKYLISPLSTLFIIINTFEYEINMFLVFVRTNFTRNSIVYSVPHVI